MTHSLELPDVLTHSLELPDVMTHSPELPDVTTSSPELPNTLPPPWSGQYDQFPVTVKYIAGTGISKVHSDLQHHLVHHQGGS